MFRAMIDPALFLPPDVAGLDPAEWVIRLQRWGDLATSGVMSMSCPQGPAQHAAATWWERRDEIIAKLATEDQPLDHGELARVAAELLERLDDTAVEGPHELAFSDVATHPRYVAPAFSEAERQIVTDHIGELAFQKRLAPSAPVVATEATSWSGDPDELLIEGEIGLWTIRGVEQQLAAGETGVREHVHGCCSPRDLLAALLTKPSALVQHPRIAVEAYVATVLGEDTGGLKFSLGSDFVSSMERMNYARDEARATACWRAMSYIVTGRVAEAGGLSAHPTRISDNPGSPYRRDASGRTLMRGYLANDTANANRIHWWTGRRAEFVAVGGHDFVPG